MNQDAMLKLLALTLTAASLIAAPAFAADTPAASKPSTAETASKGGKTDKKPKTEEKLICTREASTDSFLTKRVCRTQEQIDAERRAAQRFEDDRQLLGGRPDQPR
jgi:hypothetical protein